VLNYGQISDYILEYEMITVGTLEAKTHLSALLERAAAGEEILVTRLRTH
jgi:hypothetical protein